MPALPEGGPGYRDLHIHFDREDYNKVKKSKKCKEQVSHVTIKDKQLRKENEILIFFTYKKNFLTILTNQWQEVPLCWQQISKSNFFNPIKI